MHGRGYRVRHACDHSKQVVHAEIECILWASGEYGLVNLNLPAACVNQRADFYIQRVRDITTLALRIVVVRINRCVGNGQWSR